MKAQITIGGLEIIELIEQRQQQWPVLDLHLVQEGDQFPDLQTPRTFKQLLELSFRPALATTELLVPLGPSFLGAFENRRRLTLRPSGCPLSPPRQHLVGIPDE